jgi:hypothetical protein
MATTYEEKNIKNNKIINIDGSKEKRLVASSLPKRDSFSSAVAPTVSSIPTLKETTNSKLHITTTTTTTTSSLASPNTNPTNNNKTAIPTTTAAAGSEIPAVTGKEDSAPEAKLLAEADTTREVDDESSAATTPAIELLKAQ